MITDERIRELIASGNENRNLDYKGPFSWATAEKDEKLGIVKDILSFSNTRDGGILLIGVDDKTGEPVGLSDEDAASFDQTRFNDFIHNYTDPKHTCAVYKRAIHGKNIVIIEIPEFPDVPILCKQTAGSTADPKKILLRKSALYKRTDKASSEVIESGDAMRELLNRALLRRQDDLLKAFNQIMNPQRQAQGTVNLGMYDKEIEDADAFIDSHVGESIHAVSHWIVTLRPTNYVVDRIKDLRTLQSLVRESQVSVSGVAFPYLTQEHDSNFSRGFQSWYDADHLITRYVEGFRVYQSGLVRFKSALWEEFWPDYAERRVASWSSILYGFTEWLTFAQRFYERILDVGQQLDAEFILVNAKERSLTSLPHERPLLTRYAAHDDEINLKEIIDLAELRADATGIARRLTLRTYEIFNWNNVNDSMIADKQRLFLSGRG